MPYLPVAEVDGLIQLLVSYPLVDSGFLDSWFRALPPAYVAGLPTPTASVSVRLTGALAHFNTDAPLDGGAIPMAVALEHLVLTQANSEIVDRAKQLLSRIQVSAPGVAPTVETVFKELRLIGAGLFADRATLRERLIGLTKDDNPPALIVNGGTDVGKTHTRKLVAHAAQKTRAFRFAWVEIEKEQATDFTADWLIEELVRSLIPGAKLNLPRREPEKRWLGDLATWAIEQFATLGADRPLWMVIDGIRQPGIKPEVRAVVERLASAVGTPTGVLTLRLLLIDCDPVPILSTGCTAVEESVDHLTVADAQPFLQALLDAAAFATKWQDLQAALLPKGTVTTVDLSHALEDALR